MIIKATCYDNDFSQDILAFFKRLSLNIHAGINKKIDDYEAAHETKDLDEISELTGLYRQYRLDTEKYVKIYQSDEWSEEDKAWVIEKIKEGLYAYVARQPQEEYCSTPEERANYILENLVVEVLDTFKDAWENGEVIYWFQHSNIAIAQ